MLLTGAEIIIETLKEEKVDVIFGYPGGTVITVYDALYKRGTGIRHILTSHEQGAAHAADGYARSTGKTGVCLVTSGPGATNLVTGIATAYMDSVPLVAITINVSNSDLGKDSFQEVDIAGVTMPVTKHNFIVKNIASLASTIRRAFKIASSGRRGPVLVDITKDVTKASYEYERAVEEASPEYARGLIKEELEKAVKLISRAKKPMLLTGGGASSQTAARRLEMFARMLDLPVVDTLMGKGVFNGNDPRYLGMAGLYGTEAALQALSETDLIIAAGTRFSERVTHNDPGFAPHASIIHIDIDNAELNKNIMSDVSIAGDVSAVIKELTEMAGKSCGTNAAKRKEWLDKLCEIKKKEEERNDADISSAESEGRLTGPMIVRKVYERFGDDAIISTEVGLNQMWTATHYRFGRPGQLLTSGGLGTMGYGLGAAIGAAIGNPGRTVINFAGDGCFRMNMNEVLTAVRCGLKIVEIIFDNRALGMVHQMQDMICGGRHSETEFDDNADYAAIASAMGAYACTVKDAAELKKAIDHAVKTEKTSVIVCRIDRNEVFRLNKRKNE